MSSSSGLAQGDETKKLDKQISPQSLAAEGKMRVSVQVFASPQLPLSEAEQAALKQLSELPHVEKIVALPDLHVKPHLEAPSSLAVAVRDHLVPGFSSPSPNCGMALALSGLDWKDVSKEQLDDLFVKLADRLPLKPPSPMLTIREMEDVLIYGPRAVLDRFGFEESILEVMDQGISPLEEKEFTKEDVLKAVPDDLREIGRRMFGTVGKGNHFLELQVVDQIVNPQIAHTWGVHKGQVVFMFHADSGYLGAFVGRLYSHRLKNTWRGRLFEWRVKLPFHMRNGSKRRFLNRVHSYMVPRRYTFLPAGSEEGRRTRLGLWAAGNYANANRLAVLAALRQTLQEVWDDQSLALFLLWDAPHNSIRPEQIEGETLWVHRHNAVRVTPKTDLPAGSRYAGTGHPVLLPGTERTISYLCASGEGAGRALFSADHGAGRSALRLGRMKDGSFTRVYGYEGEPVVTAIHISNDGVQEVLEVLESAGIAYPVAALRPAAVLKARS